MTIEITVKLMVEIKLLCLLSSLLDVETLAWISQRESHIVKAKLEIKAH